MDTAEYQRRLQLLRKHFRQQLPERHARIRAAVNPTAAAATLEAARFETHRLAGLAGSLGWSELSARAAALEPELERLFQGTPDADPETLERLLVALDQAVQTVIQD
ncbi:MAG: Hpt domain-containing protein [Candidatus Competibacterales bacterium]|nr:Hpt domain-containing protein [Candidatus Competibacterales bacterium]